MTFFTGAPLQDDTLPVEGETPLIRSLGAEVAEGFNQGPFVSWGEESRLARLNSDPNAERVSQEEAKRIFKEHQIDTIDVPTSGLTKPAMDAIVQDHLAHLYRQQQLQGAPSGAVATPLKFMANLAGNLADPGNLAIGAIPFFGEARAATLLGRAGQRFAQGAGYGALQTAATLPFVAQGQAAQGNDFTMGDIASNMLLGTIGGGLIHAGGGFIADVLKARNPAINRVDERGDVPGKPVQGDPQPDTGLPIESPAAETVRVSPAITPELTAADELTAGIQRFRDDYAYQTAYNDVTPDYLANLENQASSQNTGVNDLRAQIVDAQRHYDALDATVGARTKDYQAQRLKFNEARSAALRDIEAEKQLLQTDLDSLREQIDANTGATKSAQELAEIRKGNLSEPLRQRIEQRAQEIREGLNQSPIAQGVKSAMQRYNEADWYLRNQAMRGAVAQMRRGEDVNIEPFFDLVDPEKKTTVLDNLSAPKYVEPRHEDNSSSQAAEAQIKNSGQVKNIDDELRQAEENVNYARQVNDAIASDNPEFAQALKQINEEANDTSMQKAIKAAAMCRIGKMNG